LTGSPPTLKTIRNLGRRCLGGQGGSCPSERGNDGHVAANEISGQRRQPIELTVSPTEFNRYILALDVASLL